MNDFKRREFVKLSALGFASVALHLNALTSYAQKANGFHGKWNPDTPLNWDAFLEQLSQLAKMQYDLPWKQKEYTNKVKQLLLQCDFPQFENIKREIEGYENKRPNWFESASLHYEVDFQVSLFQFEKGEYIPHHDHPEMTGVLNVVSGSLLAKNYSVEKQLTTSREIRRGAETFEVNSCILRQVENEILKGGDVGILTADEGNIHAIMPHEFSQMVDVFTPAYHQNTNAKWYQVEEAGFYKNKQGLFKAEYASIRL